MQGDEHVYGWMVPTRMQGDERVLWMDGTKTLRMIFVVLWGPCVTWLHEIAEKYDSGVSLYMKDIY
jgi:hypothetical protein